MTTAKAVGETIGLEIIARGDVTVEGIQENPTLGKYKKYTLTSQTVKIYGKVTHLFCAGNQLIDLDVSQSPRLKDLNCNENQLTSIDLSGNSDLLVLYCSENRIANLSFTQANANKLADLSCYGNQMSSLDVSQLTNLKTLYCYDNQLTSLDLSNNQELNALEYHNNQLTNLDISHNKKLKVLSCYGNQIKGEAMTQLVNNLPDRQGEEAGTFVVTSDDPAEATNLCLKTDVVIAKAKNWIVKKLNLSRISVDYEGKDPTYSVTLTKEGEGTITATGADNLTAVPNGTELTIVATPAEGYELTALTANGTDIHATKKFVVKGATEVKATFTKMAFAVTLTKEGEGTLTATGADNLTAVPYGTELTIATTPAEGYELTALTANGEDILATKKFVVKGATEVKATFAKMAFAVTLTKEGEGTLIATGADDLTAVPYGTELTIAATPAEGYELTALTANGEDILATKKFVVKGATEVKATFAKMAFAVTLTSNEHGTISIVENVDLKAVPYGTTLTIKVEGKNDKCELTALTANGEDILATKSFVVTGVTEVKATFVDHTGVETTVTQQTQLYPNPATDYVIVEGIAPASEVMLHSMTGELLCAMQADTEGHLQIDLTALSDGVYLLVGTGWQKRLVVKK